MSCLSVIVPCYNGEKFIGRCLESLVNQTLQDIEIIVINDGSTDNSQGIIDSYANEYHNIKAYKIPNSGIADARNFGVSKVETPYFGFLDCDDYTDATMFEKMYNKAIETNAQVVVSNFYWVKGKKKKLENFVYSPFQPSLKVPVSPLLFFATIHSARFLSSVSLL